MKKNIFKTLKGVAKTSLLIGLISSPSLFFLNSILTVHNVLK